MSICIKYVGNLLYKFRSDSRKYSIKIIMYLIDNYNKIEIVKLIHFFFITVFAYGTNNCINNEMSSLLHCC